MTPETRLSTALDERLDSLPSIPAEQYVAAGRARLRRRRRARVGAVAVAAVFAVGSAGWVLALGDGPQEVREYQPSVAAPAPGAGSLSSLRVDPGLGSIDSFTTDAVPEWATEYGSHGPAAIAPDGRLWIAPEATVLRSIEDPFGAAGREAGISHSYAVEVRWTGTGKGAGTDGVVWSFVYQEAGETATFGELDSPRRWTADFALWADDQVAGRLDRPSFAERLGRFADDRSEVVVPGGDVRIVRQVPDVGTGDRQQYARQTAAEVRVAGQTWFLLATGRTDGYAFYEAYDEASTGATDLNGFLRFLDAGFVAQEGVS